jgi:hypothetical protein
MPNNSTSPSNETNETLVQVGEEAIAEAVYTVARWLLKQGLKQLTGVDVDGLTT